MALFWVLDNYISDTFYPVLIFFTSLHLPSGTNSSLLSCEGLTNSKDSGNRKNRKL